MATVHWVEFVVSLKKHIFVFKDIYYAKRNCVELFSRVKSGKFSSDENKLTHPIHINTMAWAVAYFSPWVYQSLHDKIKRTVRAFSLYIFLEVWL